MSTEAEWMLLEPEENPKAVLLKLRDHYGFKGVYGYIKAAQLVLPEECVA